MEQALGWDAADIQAGAAQMLFLNEGDLCTQLGCSDGGHIAAGAATDHQHVLGPSVETAAAAGTGALSAAEAAPEATPGIASPACPI